MLFTGLLIRFACFLHAPLFDLHDIYRLLYSIYIIFKGPFFRFALYLQAALFNLHNIQVFFRITMIFQRRLFDLHDIYRLAYYIYMD